MEFILGNLTYLFAEPLNLLIVLLASVAGIVLGAIPGLAGGLGITLMLPVTFTMEPLISIATLIAIWIGGVSGSFISAVLVGIPGSGSSIATCYDGYPMTKNGKAVKALGIGIMASFLGTFFSTLVAIFVAPVVARLALMMGPWEYFALCLCAITLVVSISKGNLLKGIAAACIGLLLSCVGAAPIDGATRFTFGNYRLYGGVDMVTVMMGIFAVAQVLSTHAQGQQKMPHVDLGKLHGIGIHVADFVEHWKTILRSFATGLWIGFLPGMGSALAAIVSYGQAKNASKEPESFGKGNPDGVWAPEIANNAGIGGAIIPLISLGIPGDGVGALLLAALTIQGLQPGPLLLTSNPDIAYMVFTATLLSAVFVLIVQFFGIRLFPKLLKAPYNLLFGTILVLCMTGAYTSGNSMFSLYLVLFFGIIGVLLSILRLPNAPLMLAFVLGTTLETNFRKAISYSTTGGYTEFFTRPVSCVLILFAVCSVIFPFVKDALKRKKESVQTT